MKLAILIFLLIVNFLFSQDGKIINNESISFQIKDKNDSIDFIVFDTKLDKKKPIFLWCQGSLPYPIYVNSNDQTWLIGGWITNFDIENITKYYHLVIISMPNTPLIADESKINDSYWYFGNSKNKNIPTEEFQKSNYLENYTNRAIKVLKFLKQQKWVDGSKLVVAGHSQGSKVATKIAKHYKPVSKLGWFSANPFGRIDESIRQSRKKAERNEITWEEADKQMEEQYAFYRKANNENKFEENIDLLAWKSCSEPIINDWLSFDKPIYLAYGTNDITSDLCDLIPLFFIREKKENLTYKRYLNLEHNFFEVDNEGSVNHEKPRWKDVMNDFLIWSLK